MTETEKLLFTNIAVMGSVIAGLMKNQVETARLLAEKLPNISDEARSLQLDCAKQLDLESQEYEAKSKKLLDSVQ